MYCGVYTCAFIHVHVQVGGLVVQSQLLQLGLLQHVVTFTGRCVSDYGTGLKHSKQKHKLALRVSGNQAVFSGVMEDRPISLG